MYGLMGLAFLSAAVKLSSRGGGSLRGLGAGSQRIKDAIDKLREGHRYGPNVVEVDKYIFGFEYARLYGEPNPKGFINAWVMRGWPGHDEAREMYHSGEWNKLIAKALNVPVGHVRLGFGYDQFDVRPF